MKDVTVWIDEFYEVLSATHRAEISGKYRDTEFFNFFFPSAFKFPVISKIYCLHWPLKCLDEETAVLLDQL